MTKKQMTVADNILNRLELMDPHAIVAGGAPRDWALGRRANDIDVFVHCSEDRMGQGEFQTLIAKTLAVSLFNVRTLGSDDMQYKMNPHLLDVFETEFNGEHIQIMRMNTKTFHSVVPEFPLSICKAWYRPGSLVTEKDFNLSVKHQMIWKTKEPYANGHRYIQKVRAMFPGYKYHDSWESMARELLETL